MRIDALPLPVRRAHLVSTIQPVQPLLGRCMSGPCFYFYFYQVVAALWLDSADHVGPAHQQW